VRYKEEGWESRGEGDWGKGRKLRLVAQGALGELVLLREAPDKSEKDASYYRSGKEKL